MSDIRYCPRCRRNVDISPWDGASIVILVVLLLFGIILGIIYLLYKLMKTKRCPVCGTLETDLEPPRFDRCSGPTPRLGSESNIAQTYCMSCGTGMPAGSKFCPSCGNKVE